jgi:glycerol-3-phosphate dehydrogenase
MIGGTWGTHLILPMRPMGPQGPIYATAKKDGRPFFLLPWDGRLLVGTTDVKFTGDNPDKLEMEAWEVDYLIAETNNLFPEARYTESDVQEITVGIRPLPASDKKAGAVTRRHYLVDHSEKHGISGLASIVGGKLTTYRSLAEEAVDWTFKALGKPAVECVTGRLPQQPLVVPTLVQEAQAMLTKLGLPAGMAPRLVALYGPAFASVLDRVAADPTLGQTLGPGTPILEAQIVHAVESEEARTVEDIVHRRLMLFPPTPEAVAGAERVCRARNLLTEGVYAGISSV